jgi:hypothetical protein
MSFILLAGSRPTIDKAAAADLTYGVDVAEVLAAGDTVNGVTGDASGVTAGSPTYSGSVLRVRISGGTAGQTGSYTFTWTTAGGDTDSRTLYFNVKVR